MQRLRVKFYRGEEIKFISHLDIVRLWERVLRRAGVPLAYSQGFSPHPQLSLAVPLTVGMTSEAELLDIFCIRTVSPHWLEGVLSQQLPPGIKILEIYQVNPLDSSLQSLVRFAQYRVQLETDRSREEIETGINELLALEHLPWQHKRDTGVRNYDIRALIDEIRVIEWQPGHCTLEMRLKCDSSGSGRPEQVTAALKFLNRSVSIHRINLVLEPARAAVR